MIELIYVGIAVGFFTTCFVENDMWHEELSLDFWTMILCLLAIAILWPVAAGAKLYMWMFES